MSHGAKGEEEVWREFSDHPDDLAYESERLLAERTGVSVEQLCKIDTADLPRIGEDRERIVKTRVNQYFFRQSVLSAYGYRCCITGLALPDLLIASHIIPWAVDVKNRLNPSNGLCLNALHDKAFDRGIISLTDDFKVVLNANERIFSDSDRKVIDWFLFYVGRPITKPSKFLPSKDLLAQHRRMHNLA